MILKMRYSSSSWIWRLYSYRRGADVLRYRGIPHLLSMTQSGCPFDITVCWVPHESPVQSIGRMGAMGFFLNGFIRNRVIL